MADGQVHGRGAIREFVYRAHNQAIWRALQGVHDDGSTHWFMCECVDAACRDMIALTISQYERVRSVDSWFVVVPGHGVRDQRRVVEDAADRWVVEQEDARREQSSPPPLPW